MARQALVIVLCAGATCCGGTTPTTQPTATTTPAPLVVITSFTATPSAIFVGQRSVLRYTATRPPGSTLRVEYSALLGSVALDPGDATLATYTAAQVGTDTVVLTLTLTAPQQAQAVGQAIVTVMPR